MNEFLTKDVLRPAPIRLLAVSLAVVFLATATVRDGIASDPGAPSSSPTATWRPFGSVFAIAQSGSSVYFGGRFTYVGPSTGSFVALDANTSEVEAGPPRVTGDVLSSAADGDGGWYIGGTFTSVGGVARQHLAHIFSDGTLDSNWAPAVNG